MKSDVVKSRKRFKFDSGVSVMKKSNTYEEHQLLNFFKPVIKLRFIWGLINIVLVSCASQRTQIQFFICSGFIISSVFLWVNNSVSGIVWSDGYNRISETEWLLSSTCVSSPSRAIWRFPCWFCTVSNAGTLCSVYIHSLIRLTHNGDGGVLGNEAFISSPWPICLQWVVAAQMQIA